VVGGYSAAVGGDGDEGDQADDDGGECGRDPEWGEDPPPGPRDDLGELEADERDAEDAGRADAAVDGFGVVGRDA
jgi:hypothetical protein